MRELSEYTDLMDLITGAHGLSESNMNTVILRDDYEGAPGIPWSRRADAIVEEIRRRLALAQADHHTMWKSHLDNNTRSRGRQMSLIEYAERHPDDPIRRQLAKYSRNWYADTPGDAK